MKRKKQDHYFTTRLGVIFLMTFTFLVFMGDIAQRKDELIVPYFVPVIAEAVEPTPTPTEKDLILNEINLVFGKDAARGLNMLLECENKKLNPIAENWNGNGTWDYGLWQINSVHKYSQKELSDYKFNTQVAYDIFKHAGYSFSPWTCALSAGDIPFWMK